MQEKFPLKGIKGNKKEKNSPFIWQIVDFSFGNLWNFISQLLTQDILAFGEHFADILVQNCGGLVFVGSEFGCD